MVATYFAQHRDASAKTRSASMNQVDRAVAKGTDA